MTEPAVQKSLLEFSLKVSALTYLSVATLASLLVRVLAAAMQAAAASDAAGTAFHRRFLDLFKGYGSADTASNDYWHPFVLGVFEILVYPVLIAGAHEEYIGAWLGLKTLPQWGLWTTDRARYNRFLIGNAAVLLISYWVASRFVAPA